MEEREQQLEDMRNWFNDECAIYISNAVNDIKDRIASVENETGWNLKVEIQKELDKLVKL